MAPKPVLIAGPTASGKSAFALRIGALAQERGLAARIINADALQVYREWRILTARPDADDERAVAHTLYGDVSVREPRFSVGDWLRKIESPITQAEASNELPIIVGGTGLYFRALTRGLAEIPEAPLDVRNAVEQRLADKGPAEIARQLSARDPETAKRVDLSNPRRVTRALEVLESTGKGMAAWHDATPPPLLPLERIIPVALAPPRDVLRHRIAQRFDQMLTGGVLEEVRGVQDLIHREALPPTLPGLQALGAAPLMAHLRGEIDLDTAREIAVTTSRQYAKRQATWIRNQMAQWQRLTPENLCATQLLRNAAAEI